MHKENNNKTPTFDITTTLTVVFQDVQENSVDHTTNFTLRWMCPIYKKKERSKIENYRPITLLNTDYKLLTCVLAIQLAAEIHPLLHENQVGLVPGGSIFNQTRLAQTMIDFAEATETNGAIVALDQEKVSNKIEHLYL